MQRPEDVEGQLALADGWWALADKEKDAASRERLARIEKFANLGRELSGGLIVEGKARLPKILRPVGLGRRKPVELDRIEKAPERPVHGVVMRQAHSARQDEQPERRAREAG